MVPALGQRSQLRHDFLEGGVGLAAQSLLQDPAMVGLGRLLVSARTFEASEQLFVAPAQ